jgi:YegS/Rv2252/BmrU family lipid kinase
MPSDRTYLVLANPVARQGADTIVGILREAAPSGTEFDVHYTSIEHQVPGSLAHRAANCTAVIAIGGDGTVSDAVTAVEGIDIPIGVIPAGSTNVIARSFSIPKDLRAAAELALARPATRRIDVGICNGRRFLHMGGAGFDSRMFAATSTSLKHRIGWPAYLQGASKTILAPSAYFSIDVDGARVECESPLVLVANGSSIVSPSMKVLPDIRYDDGYLDVVIITGTKVTEIIRTIGRFVTRSLQKSPYVLHLRGKSITVRSDTPIPLQIDGDLVGDTPGEFSLLPLALDLIVPR